MEISFFALTFYGLIAAGFYTGVYWILSQCTGNTQLFITVLSLLSALTAVAIEGDRIIREAREYRNGRL